MIVCLKPNNNVWQWLVSVEESIKYIPPILGLLFRLTLSVILGLRSLRGKLIIMGNILIYMLMFIKLRLRVKLNNKSRNNSKNSNKNNNKNRNKKYKNNLYLSRNINDGVNGPNIIGIDINITITSINIL